MAPEISTRTVRASSAKIVDLDTFGEIRAATRAAGERVVLCHGVFDLLHPGHVQHLERAAELGDRLVVTVTADQYVRRGPGRPVFSHEMRMMTLAALECVDWVVLSEDATAINAIDVIQPDVYCKGNEYRDHPDGPTERVMQESERVGAYGGETRYIGGVVYSSTKLLNHHFEVLPERARSFALEFQVAHGYPAVKEAIERLSNLSVLVVGEVIIDEYISCDVQGVTGKERVPAVRYRKVQRHWGGAYAVARHLDDICGRVTIAGIAGDDEVLGGPSLPAGAPPGVERAFELDPAAQTVVKQRYVVENRLRDELGKVFAVHNHGDWDAVSSDTRRRFRERVRALAAEHDLVLVADYGHGLLDRDAIDEIQKAAPFLALNCQTNSSNYGYNLITKYPRADTFCLDETEIALAFGERNMPPGNLLPQLRARLGSAIGWLTLGAAGCIGADSSERTFTVPALTLHVRDTLGAGDAFFALASCCAAQRETLEVASFVGALAGALAVNVTGNAEAVSKDDVLKLAATVLNV